MWNYKLCNDGLYRVTLFGDVLGVKPRGYKTEDEAAQQAAYNNQDWNESMTARTHAEQ